MGFFGEHREAGLGADDATLALLGDQSGAGGIEQFGELRCRHENRRYRVVETKFQRSAHADVGAGVRESVRQTLADYTAATDRFDLGALAACFGAEGVLEFTGGTNRSSAPRRSRPGSARRWADRAMPVDLRPPSSATIWRACGSSRSPPTEWRPAATSRCTPTSGWTIGAVTEMYWRRWGAMAVHVTPDQRRRVRQGQPDGPVTEVSRQR